MAPNRRKAWTREENALLAFYVGWCRDVDTGEVETKRLKELILPHLNRKWSSIRHAARRMASSVPSDFEALRKEGQAILRAKNPELAAIIDDEEEDAGGQAQQDVDEHDAVVEDQARELPTPGPITPVAETPPNLNRVRPRRVVQSRPRPRMLGDRPFTEQEFYGSASCSYLGRLH